MPLLPNASIKTKYDFTRSRFEWKRQFQVAPTANIVEEGAMLIRVPGVGGEEVVTMSATGAVAAGEALAGLALISRITADTFTDFRQYTVPAAPGPFQIQLPHGNLVVNATTTFADVYIWDLTAAAQIQCAAAPAPGFAYVDIPSGLITFDAGAAEHDITVQYKWYLTAVERDLILRQSHVNRGAEDQFGLMTVGYGNCVVYSSMYEGGVAYAVGDRLYLIPGGCVSTVDPGGAYMFGRVVSVPKVGDPYLGFEYNSAVV